MVRFTSVTRAARASWPYIRHTVCVLALLYLVVVVTLAIHVLSRYPTPHSWRFDPRCGTLILIRFDERLAPGAPDPPKEWLDKIPIIEWSSIEKALRAAPLSWSPDALQLIPSSEPGLSHPSPCATRILALVAQVLQSGTPVSSTTSLSLSRQAAERSFLAVFFTVLFATAATVTGRLAYGSAKDVFKQALDQYDAAEHPAAVAWYAIQIVTRPPLVLGLAVLTLSLDGLLMRYRA